jgi:cellulose synthase/poly-beta-1,6-N-acetylglucosamine synthase-like glycosyltransferase
MYHFFTWTFFISAFLIFYSYVIFPAILSYLEGKRKNGGKVRTENSLLPGVSIIVSVFNEEQVIDRKITSILESDYPKERLEILIGSDASSDKTNEIVKKFTTVFSFIKFFEYTERRGKPAVINDLVKEASNNILIFTDANVLFEKGLIGELVTNFSDPKTGLAGANILNIGLKKDGISIERENLIKYREGLLWGCMMGPFGGCYAVRKELYENVPAGYLVDDFYISMKVIGKNYKCINDLDAICYEDVSNDMHQEYKRKSRISAGNFQNLKAFSYLLFKPFTPAGFCFISHKVLRWITPFLIVVSFISLAVLSFYHRYYFYLFICEVLMILSPVFDHLVSKAGFHFRFLRFVSYFSYMNLALLRGFFRYMKGIESGVWTPTKRNG